MAFNNNSNATVCIPFSALNYSNCSVKPDEIVYLIACGILSFLIICANLIVIIVFLKTRKRKLKNSQAVYKTSIAFSDLLVGIIILPANIIMWAGFPINLPIPFLTFLYIAHSISWTLATTISIVTLIIMGFERLYAVTFVLKFLPDRAHFIAVRVVIATWVISIALMVVLNLVLKVPPTDYVSATETMIFFMNKTTHVVILAISVALVWLSGIALFIVVQIHSRNAPQIACNSTIRLQRQSKLAVTVFLMTTAFALSTLPAIIYLFFVVVRTSAEYTDMVLGHEESWHAVVSAVGMRKWEASVVLIFLSNSLWNCFVYSFRDRVFLQEFRRIIRCASTKSTPLASGIPNTAHTRFAISGFDLNADNSGRNSPACTTLQPLTPISHEATKPTR